MKIRYILLVLVLFIAGAWQLGKMSDQAYADCVAAGIQSNDTCKFYAYQ